MKTEQQDSIWQEILDQNRNISRKESINIILLGDKNSGKKKIIELLAQNYGEFVLFKNDIKKSKDSSSTYMMDF